MRVSSASGRRVGRVADVLFAPTGRRVAGFVVQRPRFLWLFDRKDRYVALDRCDLAKREVTVRSGRDAWGRTAASRLGFSWDDAVIWVGMPAATERGDGLGKVRDGLFDPATGELDALGLTGGLTADVAVGVRDLPADLVRGFDGSAVVLSNEAATVDTSGGAAVAAGKGAAVAKKAGVDAAKKAAEAGRTAAAYGSAAVRVAARSDVGKKAAGWVKSLKNEVVDAMGDPDDE